MMKKVVSPYPVCDQIIASSLHFPFPRLDDGRREMGAITASGSFQALIVVTTEKKKSLLSLHR